MITQNKKFRVKWVHHNFTGNSTSKLTKRNFKKQRSYTECFIYDMSTNEQIGYGKATLSLEDKNYIKAYGRLMSTDRASAKLSKEDRDDIFQSLSLLPSQQAWNRKFMIDTAINFLINYFKN